MWNAVIRNKKSIEYYEHTHCCRITLQLKGNSFMKGHVVDSYNISASTNLMSHRTGHPFLCYCIHLPLSEKIRRTFACFLTDAPLAAILT